MRSRMVIRFQYPVVMAVACGAAYFFCVGQRESATCILLIRGICVTIAAVACTLAASRHAIFGKNHSRAGAVSQREWSQAETKLIVAAVGLWFGSAASAATLSARSGAYTGIMPCQVTAFSGSVSADSHVLGSGRILVSMNLSRTYGRDGLSADARGNVLLFVRDNDSLRVFSRGEHLFIRERLLRAESADSQSDAAGYLCFADAGSIRSEGIPSLLMRIRSAILGRLFQAIVQMGADAGPLFRALFTGNQDALSPSTILLFRRAGCAHILALSGMHLTILTGLIGWTLSRLFGRNGGYAAAVFCVITYVMIVGDRASLVRAALMYVFAGYATTRGRSVNGMALLSLCFVVQLALYPESGITLSFQLSYLALSGILLLAPPLVHVLSPFTTRGVASIVSAGLGAQIAVMPLIVVSFGSLCPAGVIAGAVIGVLVMLFLWAGLLFLFLTMFFQPMAEIVAVVVQRLSDIMLATAGFASRLPEISPPLPVAVILCVTIAVICLRSQGAPDT